MTQSQPNKQPTQKNSIQRINNNNDDNWVIITITRMIMVATKLWWQW